MSNNKFILPFGKKISGGNAFNPKMDVTDQRSPINDPEALYNQFIMSEELKDELDSESIDDFLEDVHPYDDRSEYGVDVAIAAQAEIASAAGRLASRKEPPASFLKRSAKR